MSKTKRSESKKSEPKVVDPNVAEAHQMLSKQQPSTPIPLIDIYQAHRDNVRVPTVEIRTDKPSVNVLFLSELLLGHQDSAVDFFVKIVNSLRSLPDDMRPDVIVMSGLLQGDFKFLQKNRRLTLVPELSAMGEQFRYGRQLLDILLKTGIPLVYNLSNDDRRIAEDYTIEVFRKMHHYARKGKSPDHSLAQSTVNYADIDKMRQNSEWNRHLSFQINTVFPYCLRSGRRLRSASEMSELTDGKVETEEYFLLFRAKERLDAGKPLKKKQRRWLEVGNITDHGFKITDDLDLSLRTAGRHYTDEVRHNLGFSQQPMYVNHMKTLLETIQQEGQILIALPPAILLSWNIRKKPSVRIWAMVCGRSQPAD